MYNRNRNNMLNLLLRLSSNVNVKATVRQYEQTMRNKPCPFHPYEVVNPYVYITHIVTTIIFK